MSNPKFGVVVFPGSNCDHDTYYVLRKIIDVDVVFLWHKQTSLEGCNIIILPGGFAYGDYLRTGAVARFSPIMTEVIRFANNGGYVFGICNGFQILLEAGLLPGVMIRNESLNFVCKDIYLKIENSNTVLTKGITNKSLLKIPIAHGEGNYFTDEKTLGELEDNHQIVFRYSTIDGSVNSQANPNGSISNIAGIMNKKGNVFGMMPHPERSSDPVLGKTDGSLIFNSLVNNIYN
ncbi:MAG: phosphoribosylformylglycinamidine synthase subunit PurQ [Ignavibacteriota bacterium]|jgi:phosphoribosylformylglycinamidine synthase|nr:MAG: phosphoribosylformylglycinamidine synthase subunit PurQ [Chlorobiota bacterium]MBE7478299.1 phosphoribosylformylglycinamidine synthase subunit PurQ [Ignavibacteriales bacterium]MBL1121470.1 phosphoribosylformylglycinamidine synthase subunit PurQ [Ignavibacteriota bacterium]MCC7094656.1 phosphoribosylformylglycinamidine synthase subunit PurQ [Ignavibacteriaceae bacterium]MCE7857025.1 phosphoribosylformylglycinamidine synthase subunit PurQ [Ignavibacteria bacterium CHB3]MEB2297793.1 phos